MTMLMDSSRKRKSSVQRKRSGTTGMKKIELNRMNSRMPLSYWIDFWNDVNRIMSER